MSALLNWMSSPASLTRVRPVTLAKPVGPTRVAAAVVVLPMVIDPNDYKPQIVEKAKQQLGRDFAIEQDLKLSVFPWLGIETGGVRVGNAEGFKAESFAEIDQLGLKVKLLPRTLPAAS